MPAPAPLHILILSAGASSRMRGRDKLMEPIGRAPLLRHVVEQALATGLPVTVTLRPDRPLRMAALEGLPIRRITVARPDDGLSASLRAGLAALPATAAVMVLLADLPEITTADLTTLAAHQAAHPDALLRGADADGTPGHPVIFPPWARTDLLQLSGDEGARALLAAHRDRVIPVRLPGRHATTDLDTPEAWAAWRAQTAATDG